MTATEKIELNENTDFDCPICSYKLDLIPQESSGRLEYICSNKDCQTQILYDKFEDQWYKKRK